ncbi:pentatricopeptide repeat-containing protein At1g19720-like [Amaranthus tricolor]|uniref:pentatricopeptide repeat-containing protein At1g19720-like n=1 Tax=Amaranthus tricolor TaxID=29722 RepID=UPI0025905FCA|nr:pentatricopeptide repeat-containing protein At1g19720-like [Amaranthus tricolor]XP_057543034.1 pentatricopeptide repeat-containing protein At1g19720-like [Amaranthus tricolor]XP_057543035.1 pentatricopeptide repeat-containing protein At1g19720-like [Amaranthus tricolor]XP_057543036.1 pentatricopeptide repeat-containing protein At1g19720-like [Amaranthus tricolor]XP_057543038.1 pentatricopeptide repeat-containing protein At1g19720-like [Amaranthus tricolor]XP_057543039.1 pentatricopeptide re
MSTFGLHPSISLYSTSYLSSLQCQLNFVPKFRTEARTPQIPSLQDLPRPERFSRVQHADDFINSNHLAAKDEIAECLFLLDNLIRKGGNTNCSPSACKQIHGLLVKVGALKADTFLGNKLLVAYSKSLELLDDARKLFDELSERTINAYASLISSFCQSEKWVDLFVVFEMMLNDGMLPDRFLLPTICKACSVMQVGKCGEMVHGYAIRRGLDEDVVVGNALIDMYTNYGSLKLSKSVFNTMRTKDVVSWTALIVAYMFHGVLDEAMDTFCKMELDGVEADLISWNALISGFAMNGEIERALRTLEEMQRKGMRPQVNSWNGIISGCIKDECLEDALDTFVKMLWNFLTPNIVTIVSILPACAGLKDLNLGKAIHGYSLKFGFQCDAYVGGSLINMYWKCGRIDNAENIFVRIKSKTTFICNEMVAAYVSEGYVEQALKLFNSMKDFGPKPDEITCNTVLSAYFRDGRIEKVYELLYDMSEMGLLPNVVTFNILVTGYQQHGQGEEALRFFQAMQSPHSGSFLSQISKNPIQPNPVTVTGALAACADLGFRRQGKELHAYIVKKGLDLNTFVSTALVDMYAKCNDMDSAIEAFWRASSKNTVTWNTLIAGYVNRRQEPEAFRLFDRMLKEGVEPSSVTYMILIPACGEVEAFRLGREMFGYLLKNRFNDSDSYLANPLIDTHHKCDGIKQAKLVFDSKLRFRDIFKNSLLMKYIHYTSFVPISGHLQNF